MTQEQQIKIISNLDESALSLIKSKSKDYGQSEDVLSNFKVVSKIVKLAKIDTTTPEGYAMLMVILKIVRIWNLKSEGKTPENEGIQDSYKDGINYFKLAFCTEMEGE